jgi:hypothetical protein
VTPGSGYSISEAVPAGWYKGSATCDNGSNPSNITVSPEETVTCRFVNSRGYARPKGATPVRVSLTPAYKPCTSPNSTHGGPPPLAKPSCKPPVPESGELTVGTPDANGKGANSIGSVEFDVVIGNPSTPADEADVKLTVSLTDVRRKSDLSDYTGELQGSTGLRIVDKLNGQDEVESATMEEIPLPFTIPCSATTSGTIGSSCATSTSADALLPGFVPEGKRSIWQLDQVKVFDGGADGSASTTDDNTLFADQGVFIP